MYNQQNGHKEAFTIPCSYIVLCVISQGRVCNSAHKVTNAWTGVSSGVVRSVSIFLEESAPSAGTVEPTRGPSHLQQSLLCTAELERPQVTYTVHFASYSVCSWIIIVNSAPLMFQHSLTETPRARILFKKLTNLLIIV